MGEIWPKIHFEKDAYGQEITVKEVLVNQEAGMLDPLELPGAQAMDGLENLFGPHFTLEEQRTTMGFDSLDLTHGSVETHQETILGLNGDIPISIYRPTKDGALPCVVYFHGGGFIGGSCKRVENPCKFLAQESGALVVSVEYRLAPENPYPAGLQDGLDVLNWVYHQSKALSVDSKKIGVAGDSAGGNFAAACALYHRDTNRFPLAFQGLIYPLVNLGGVSTPDYQWDEGHYTVSPCQSRLVRNAIYGLDPSEMVVANYYVGQRTTLFTHPYVSPYFTNHCGDLPPTLLMTAEFDYLRLEGEAYAHRMKQAGCEVTSVRYQGMTHGFLSKLGHFPQAADGVKTLAGFVKNHCATMVDGDER